MVSNSTVVIDDKYEFSAPKYFDFCVGETPEEAAEAERWFEIPKCYLPSPFVAKSRSLLESKAISCEDSTYNEVQKLIARISSEHGEAKISGYSGTTIGSDASGNIIVSESGKSIGTDVKSLSVSSLSSKVLVNTSGNDALEDEQNPAQSGLAVVTAVSGASGSLKSSENPDSTGIQSVSSEYETSTSEKKDLSLSGKADGNVSISKVELEANSVPKIEYEPSISCSLVVGRLIEGQSNTDLIANCTTVNTSSIFEAVQTNDAEASYSPKSQKATDKSCASVQRQIAAGNLVANQDSTLVENNEPCLKRLSQTKMLKHPAVRSQKPKPDLPSGSHTYTERQYANKRQKLEGGLSRQIRNLRENVPTIKAVPTLTVPQAFHFQTDERFQLHRGSHCQAFAQNGNPVSPYVPLAERVLKFQFGAAERFRNPPENHPLRLTRPKEPDLLTSQRARPPRIKSSAELEEQMLINMPKFKARPLNKKILEAPTMPALPRSTPQLPEFQEFNLRTAERAVLHPSISEKFASGPGTKFIFGSDKHNSMLKSGFRASSGHCMPTTSSKQRTIERIEEQRPLKRLRISECYPDMKSMPYNQHQDAIHLQRSAKENSHLLPDFTTNVLLGCNSQTNANQIPQSAVAYRRDSVGMENIQHVMWKENVLNPSQVCRFTSGSTQDLNPLKKGTFKVEVKSLPRKDVFLSESKRKPLSEICTPFELKANNIDPTVSTLEGKLFHDESSLAYLQNYSAPGYRQDSHQIPSIQRENSSFTSQDSQTVAFLSVPHHMR